MFVKTEIKTTLEFGTEKDEDRELSIKFDRTLASIYIDGELLGTVDVKYFIEFLNVCNRGIKSLDYIS